MLINMALGMRLRVIALVTVVLAVLASGCTTTPAGDWDGRTLNENTSYEYYNKSGSSHLGGGNVTIKGDFSFMVYGENTFWLRPNDTAAFDVVFNNLQEDGKKHNFIARAFPAAADFDVMAAYQCLHFTTCDALLSRMRLMLDQQETPIEINHTFVGLYDIKIRIPGGTPAGVYMFNVVACKEIAFADCTETATNFGPNVPIVVHVLE
jgi:hypothetical protein